ncbi:hypothetical protein NE237_027438 [Protea cynaroides]|uniref:Uncharacterized protein n=1 Tax=Protea cynaroides TaxID=273540 RepID=A0A9Q0GPC3_9MAGN|nr:hypothetical protein NE237_027438 [Protea cynaroides]
MPFLHQRLFTSSSMSSSTATPGSSPRRKRGRTKSKVPSVATSKLSRLKVSAKRHKDDVFKEVLKKYKIESGGYKWASQVMGKQWKSFKGELKADTYDRYDSYAERIENCDDRVPIQQWKELIHIWEQDSTKA